MRKIVDEVIARFRDGETILLTKEEEKAFVYCISDEGFLGCGTSRAVYELPGTNYVVKLAMSHGGVVQNHIEKTFFDEIGGDWLAHLYAHGQLINVMEKVDDCQYFCEWEYDDDSEVKTEIMNLIDTVDELTGYDGGDNKQIGYSSRINGWVVYDYGYGNYDEYTHSEMVDNVGYWMSAVSPIDNAYRIFRTGIIPTYQELEKEAREYYDEQEEIESSYDYEEDYYEED